MLTTTSVFVNPTTRPFTSSPSVMATNVFSYTLSYFSFSSFVYTATFRLSMLQSKSSCAVGAATGAFVVAVASAVTVATSAVSCDSAFELTILFSDIIKPRVFNRGSKITKNYPISRGPSTPAQPTAYRPEPQAQPTFSPSGPITPVQTSPTRFWKVQRWPNGSSSVPCRYPYEWVVIGCTIRPPAAAALSIKLSGSSKKSPRLTVVPPMLCGPRATDPGISWWR